VCGAASRERERWGAGDDGDDRRRRIGEGEGPLRASTTDKNRYYEFTAAPRLRGIATITSSVVARVVGARTPVASPAVATVDVVVAVKFSCLSAIIYGPSAVFDRRRRAARFIPHRVIALRTRSAKSTAKWINIPMYQHTGWLERRLALLEIVWILGDEKSIRFRFDETH